MGVRGRRILVVEDEEDILNLYLLLFEEAGYEVCISATGAEVDVLLNSFKPDLIVMDVNLGPINGSELCSYIKAKSSIPIFLVTAEMYGRQSLLASSGANGIIRKPFDIEDLLARLEEPFV